MANKGIMLTTLLVLALSLCLFRGQGHGDLATPPPCDCGSSNNNNNNNNNNVVHDVTQYGALGDGKPVYKKGENSNGIAFIKAWQEACHSSTGPSKVVIPPGKYVVAQIIFAGPCKSNNITVELQGDLIADADVTQFPNHEFVVFENVDGVTFTGQGSIDISNQASKACTTTPTTNTNNKDAGNKGVDDFFKQMASIKLCGSKNIVIEGITSINPASNHVLVLESQNIIVRNIKFNANSNSNLNGSFNGNANGVVALKSNTSNGVYISASTQVSVSNSFINTANDCVTVAPGSSSISLTGLTCASGNGISIGGLAFTKAHLDVKGVLVKNCVFKGSAFGVKINPRLEAKLSLISDINLEGLIMDAVKCPIFINQQQISLRVKASIQAKIQNVIISNLRGTATTRSPLSFACSPFSPCKGIKVDNIDLSFIGNVLHGKEDQSIIGKTIHGKALGFLVNCLNAHVVFGGKHEGLNCNLLQ